MESPDHIAGVSDNDPGSSQDPVPWLNRDAIAPNGHINGRERLVPGDRLVWLPTEERAQWQSSVIFEAKAYCQVVSRTWSPKSAKVERKGIRRPALWFSSRRKRNTRSLFWNVHWAFRYRLRFGGHFAAFPPTSNFAGSCPTDLPDPFRSSFSRRSPLVARVHPEVRERKGGLDREGFSEPGRSIRCGVMG